MNKKKVIVVGHEGQDGRLLIQSLLKHQTQIIGIGRKNTFHYDIKKSDQPIDITKIKDVYNLIKAYKPTHIYYLAAYHNSSEYKKIIRINKAYENSYRINVLGLVNFLSAIADLSPNSRLFYASSSLIYSGLFGPIQNEATPRDPIGFYGITKTQGMQLCSEFRNEYGVYASTGILYNHESHLRKNNFLSSKIISSAIRISKGSSEKIIVGNLNTSIDWGYAKDFINAFQKILTLETPDDYIIATGEAHTVQEFIDIVLDYFSIQKNKYLIEDTSILIRNIPKKIGDARKLKRETNWQPSMNFDQFVLQLIKDHLSVRN